MEGWNWKENGQGGCAMCDARDARDARDAKLARGRMRECGRRGLRTLSRGIKMGLRSTVW